MGSCSQESDKIQRVSIHRWLIAAALLPIKCYQYCISPMLGSKCRFEPSCSHYAVEAIESRGLIAGTWLALKRLGKCHPWHRGGYDPVPKAHKH